MFFKIDFTLHSNCLKINNGLFLGMKTDTNSQVFLNTNYSNEHNLDLPYKLLWFMAHGSC